MTTDDPTPTLHAPFASANPCAGESTNTTRTGTMWSVWSLGDPCSKDESSGISTRHKSTIQPDHVFKHLPGRIVTWKKLLHATMGKEPDQSSLPNLLHQLEPLLCRSEDDNRVIVVMTCGIAGEICLDFVAGLPGPTTPRSIRGIIDIAD